MKENKNECENIIDMLKINNLETNDTATEKYKLQCILPDYVFDKLTDKEKTEFEQAITNYPDLEKEVKEAKELFYYIEKFDYKKMMYDKTQYLPDRVVANLEKRNKLYKPYKTSWKKLLAVGVLAGIVLVYFYFVNNNATQIENLATQHDITDFFTEAEKNMIAEIDDITFDDIEDTPTYLQELLLNNSGFVWQEFDNDYLFTISTGANEIIQSYGTISINPAIDYMYLIEELEDIDENHFQSLLNVIENL